MSTTGLIVAPSRRGKVECTATAPILYRSPSCKVNVRKKALLSGASSAEELTTEKSA